MPTLVQTNYILKSTNEQKIDFNESNFINLILFLIRLFSKISLSNLRKPGKLKNLMNLNQI